MFKEPHESFKSKPYAKNRSSQLTPSWTEMTTPRRAYIIRQKFKKLYSQTDKKWYNRGHENDKKKRQSYPSDLTDEQWAEIAQLFTGMRVYKWSKHELMNAVMYVKTIGCQCRQLPHDFPPYSTAHSFFRRAKLSGLWDRILEHLVKRSRENAGQTAQLGYAIIDSQSIKTTGPRGVKNKLCKWKYRIRLAV